MKFHISFGRLSILYCTVELSPSLIAVSAASRKPGRSAQYDICSLIFCLIYRISLLGRRETIPPCINLVLCIPHFLLTGINLLLQFIVGKTSDRLTDPLVAEFNFTRKAPTHTAILLIRFFKLKCFTGARSEYKGVCRFT